MSKPRSITIRFDADDLERFEDLIRRGREARNVDNEQQGLYRWDHTEAEFNHERNRVIRWLINKCIDEYDDYPIGVARRIDKSHPEYRRLKAKEERERRRSSGEESPNILRFPTAR